MLDQRSGREANPGWVQRQYSWEQVERRDWDDNKPVF